MPAKRLPARQVADRKGQALVAMRMTGLEGQPVQVKDQTLETLSARLDGSLLRPGQAAFQQATTVWNGMISKIPAIVIQPLSASDVHEAVGFARANAILLSLKGGGHNVAGTSLVDGGLTLDMSRMRTVTVDPARRLVRVGAGCLLGDVDRATQEHGLATVLGADSETGVAGLTLGGGFGYLSRRFGWTVDNLQAVEIVTADGQVRRAAEDEHEDLFWAVRGGGGNFGAVTRFTFRLHEVGPLVTGGLVAWDGQDAGDVLTLYRDLTEAAPRELTLLASLCLAPRAAHIPQPWHGKPVAAILACHTGDPAAAAADLAPLRSFGKPIADLIAPRSYCDQQSLLNASWPNGMHNYWKSEFLPRLPGGALEAMREQAASIASPLSQSVLFQLGGAIADRDATATAFGNRDAAHAHFAAGSWTPADTDGDRHRAWARAAWKAIRPYSTGGGYINAQMADEDETRTRQAYRDNHDRLAKVKAIYDPSNLFRINRNITPAA